MHVRWLGMFENLARARRHFLIVIPVTVGLIFVLLMTTFGNLRETLIVLVAVPFAFVGGMLALYVRGMNLNVSSAVGFATLFGVAIMDGVVLVQWITNCGAQGLPLDEAIVQGARRALPADSDHCPRGHSGPAAGLGRRRPGIRRAASVGNRHCVGTGQLDDADAVHRAGALPHRRATRSEQPRRIAGERVAMTATSVRRLVRPRHSHAAPSRCVI